MVFAREAADICPADARALGNGGTVSLSMLNELNHLQGAAECGRGRNSDQLCATVQLCRQGPTAGMRASEKTAHAASPPPSVRTVPRAQLPCCRVPPCGRTAVNWREHRPTHVGPGQQPAPPLRPAHRLATCRQRGQVGCPLLLRLPPPLQAPAQTARLARSGLARTFRLRLGPPAHQQPIRTAAGRGRRCLHVRALR
jgi:hypothetical protein